MTEKYTDFNNNKFQTFNVSKWLKLTIMLFAFLGLIKNSKAQQSITNNSAFTVNFNSIGSSATAALPTGFKIGTDWSSGTTVTTVAYGTSGTGAVTGSSSGGAVNWANGVLASSTDRSIGFLSTNGFTSPRSIIFAFTNNTGSAVTSISLAWNYEKYRSGSRAFDWTFFHGSTSTASTAETAGNQSYAADANNTVISNPPTSISKSFSITGLSIPNGGTYYLRWTYTGNGGSSNAQGLSIDDVSVTLVGTTAPTVTSSAATSISTTDAILNGNVTSDGGASITERGFVYNTTAGVTIADNKTAVSGTTGAFTLTPSLSVNTQYYFKAFATNSVNTTLSSPELSFFTLANTPTAPTVNNPQTNSLDVTIGGSDGNPSSTTYAIQETASGNYVQANGTLSGSAVWQSAVTWGTKTVTGLSASTLYTFQVKARNGANTETSFGSTANGTTSAAAQASVTLSNTAISSGNVIRSNQAIIQQFKIDVVNLNATINQVDLLTSGNYQTADINFASNTSGFALWYNTSYSLSGATRIGSFLSSSASGSGEILSFTGLSQTITAGNSGFFLVTADIASAATLGRTIGADAISHTDITYSATVTKSGSSSASGAITIRDNAPTLTSDNTQNNVDNDIEITFTETLNNASFRTGVSSITVNGNSLNSNQYDLTQSGKIILKPSVAGNTFLRTSGSKAVVIVSANYSTNGTVTQQIDFGTATQLTNNTAPTAPATNGAVLAVQPSVNIADQYGNTVTSNNSSIVSVAATQGTWTLGGTLTATASSGIASFSGLTATSAALVSNASLDFTATSLTGVTSATFNIPAPAPANDACSGSVSLTVNASATSGSNVSATKSSPSTLVFANYTSTSTVPDVWYSFTPTCSGSHTITVTPTGFDVVFAVFSGGTCPDPTFTTNRDAGASGVAETHTFTVTAGTTYRILVYGYSGATGSFTVGVTTAVNSSLTLASTGTPAAANITSGASNATLFGFGLTPTACNNIDITSVSISTAGTATSSDLSNFRLIYDANSNGTADAGEISSPIGTVASLSNPLVFSGLSGQTFSPSTARRYLLIADVNASPTGGATFSASLTNANVTSSASVNAATASGNTMTITTSTLTIANNTQVTAANVLRASSSNIIHRTQVTVGGSQNANITNMRFVTPASASAYTGTEIESAGFKLWRSTSNDFNTAIQIGSGISSVKATSNTSENLDFTTSQTLLTGTTYYYWLTVDLISTATLARTITTSGLSSSSITASGVAISGSTSASGAQTIIAPTLTIAENTAVTASNVFVNTNNNVIAKAQFTISNANVTITDINFVTAASAGGYTSADISSGGFKLLYSTSNNIGGASQYGSSVSSSKVTANSTETLTFSSNQTLTSGQVYYVWLTADIDPTATAGRTITVNGLSSASIISTTLGVNETGTTATSGVQTISVPTITIANTGTPAAGSIGIGISNVVVFGFALTPNISADLTAINIQTSGTVTSSDLSNFRLIYDANSDGAASAGEISATLGTVSSLSSTMSFSGISGQTGISSIRRYLLIADISSGAISGRTITGSVSITDITSTATAYSGSASGNAMTVARLLTAGDIAIIGFGSSVTDKFAFLLLSDLPANSVLYFTDNAWNGTSLLSNEGTITWTSPNSILTSGTIVTCSNTSVPTFSSGSGVLSNTVALASGGDQILCYRGTTVGSVSEFISAFSSSTWLTNGTVGNGTSYLPTGLTAGVNASNFSVQADNMYFNNTLNGPVSIIRALANNSANWVTSGSSQTFPSFTSSIGSTTTLSANATVSNLNIGDGEKLNLGSSYTLTITGTISGTGTIEGNSGSNITISGASGTINFDQTTPGTTNVLRNLTISGSGTTTLGNTLNITGGATPGVVTVASGATLNTGGNLILKSDASGTASIGNSTGTISGNVTVERFIPRRRAFRFLASPVNTSNFISGSWQQATHITGSLTGANGFDQSNSGTASLFTYNASSEAWAAIPNTNSTNLNIGTGYRMLIRGDRNINLNTTTPQDSAALVLSATGTVITGNVVFGAGSVSSSPAGIPALNAAIGSGANSSTVGWSLIGNPYASAVNWANVTKSNVSTTFATWNVNNAGRGSYVYHTGAVATGNGASNIINSGQSIFVQTTAANPSITFTEASKVTSTPPSHFKKSLSDVLNIDIFIGDRAYDALTVLFDEKNNNEYDVQDFIKLVNPEINFYSYLADGTKLAMNSMKEITSETIIPLGLNGVFNGGSYELKFSNQNTFNNSEVYLKDKFINKTYDLKSINNLTFNVTADSNSFGENRFELIFSKSATGLNKELSSSNNFIVFPNPANNVLNLSLTTTKEDNYNFTIYNQLGAEVNAGSLDFNAKRTHALNIENLSNGVYFIQVKNGKTSQTIKFIK